MMHLRPLRKRLFTRFMGSAIHGGGSCQLSLTEDLAPSKESIWKVIKSYEGGCPANVEGGLSGDANADNGIQLDFAIPEDIHSGKYTLAWTWFNHIGDREMYMNCAPITVDSPSLPVFNQSIQNQAQDYPPMFIANINGCMTPQNLDIRFPQPGKNVELNGLARNILPDGQPVCTGTPEFGDSAAMDPIVPDLEKGNHWKAISYSPSTSPVSIQPLPCSCRASRRNTSHQ
ncbi:CAZyme family AA11 [Penicillium roqueforti]|nr:CAZyme family AA11 [Penicillium roqueforti]KAI3211366.1 CAZyme family AA11 [Penicillium roqueforti]KAI3299639.1 CAZyme family AA11 [Penicillium roqueforti]